MGFIADQGASFTNPFTMPQKEKTPTRFQKPKVIVIAGPTAVGKTKHSLIIAKALGGEIISADSMQVYKGMDIGTAKAPKEALEEIPHHLIDIRTLKETFNVVDFYEEAMRALRSILARDRVPIIVGGTGFYLHALIYGPPLGPPADPEFRARLEEEAEQEGLEKLYERLVALDPEYAQSITSNDQQKIIRGLEIIAMTDGKVSEIPVGKEPEQKYDFRCWFLHRPREVLYPHIEMRCDEMIASGIIDEVRFLEAEGLRQNQSASQSIGYRQCLEFLDSPQSHEDFDYFVQTFKTASRRYAKRQFTWFRKEPLFKWLDVEKVPLEQSTEIILQDYELGL